MESALVFGVSDDKEMNKLLQGASAMLGGLGSLMELDNEDAGSEGAVVAQVDAEDFSDIKDKEVDDRTEQIRYAIHSGRPLQFTKLFAQPKPRDVCGPFAVKVIRIREIYRAESDVKLFESFKPLPQPAAKKGLVYKPVKNKFQSLVQDNVDRQDGLQLGEHHPINTMDWESQIIVDDDCPQPMTKFQGFNIANYDLEMGDWDQSIIWDENDVERLTELPVEINMNDPYLSIEVQRHGGANSSLSLDVQNRLQQTTLTKQVSYNLSNDAYYQTQRKTGRVRQQFGRIFIQHSLPALKLQVPCFKRQMTKSELRSWHRPQFQINAGDTLSFQKVKCLKKMRVRGRDVTDVLTHVRDITLKDNSDFILFEYAEEYPPLISNVGMGSFITNFYRKKDEKDQFTPKLLDGMPGMLEQVDASPFFCFGDVPMGDTVQAIKNNLFVAPIFKQELHNDDYLLVRTVFKGVSRSYLRVIPRIYAVGQIIPVAEIQPPQSRKHKIFVKDRLRVAAFRRIRKRGKQTRYGVSRIIGTFHRYNEQSLRKHLKSDWNIEKSKKTGNLLISVKDKVQLPSEQELIRLVSPEQACIFETMRVGLQRLADCGYGTGEIADDGTEENVESQLDDEVRMSPWNLSKNVQMAVQGKGMICINGPGDPTGCGLGFSFFWFSMKDMFLWAGATKADYDHYYATQVKTGHKFSLHDQQRYYKQEMKKVWEAQAESLSSVKELEDENSNDKVTYQEGGDQETEAAEAEMQEMMKILDDTKSQASRSLLAPKGYLIKRLIEGKWQEEVLTDPRVINAYLKQKQMSQYTNGDTANMEIDDDEAQKKRIKQEIAQLKKEHGFTQVQLAEGPLQRVEKDGTRRLGVSMRTCTSCKQIGHIMTNKICPNFATNFPDRVKKEKSLPEGPIKSMDGKIVINTVMLKQHTSKNDSPEKKQ